MFTDREIEMMSISYFNVIGRNRSLYELRSRRSDQIWGILPISLEGERGYYKLLHKYTEEENYHFQTDCGSVLDAVLEIINHDDHKLHRRSGDFEEVIAKFG